MGRRAAPYARERIRPAAGLVLIAFEVNNDMLAAIAVP